MGYKRTVNNAARSAEWRCVMAQNIIDAAWLVFTLFVSMAAIAGIDIAVG